MANIPMEYFEEKTLEERTTKRKLRLTWDVGNEKLNTQNFLQFSEFLNIHKTVHCPFWMSKLCKSTIQYRSKF